jgi:hypothetical protein
VLPRYRGALEVSRLITHLQRSVPPHIYCTLNLKFSQQDESHHCRSQVRGRRIREGSGFTIPRPSLPLSGPRPTPQLTPSGRMHHVLGLCVLGRSSKPRATPQLPSIPLPSAPPPSGPPPLAPSASAPAPATPAARSPSAPPRPSPTTSAARSSRRTTGRSPRTAAAGCTRAGPCASRSTRSAATPARPSEPWATRRAPSPTSSASSRTSPSGSRSVSGEGLVTSGVDQRSSPPSPPAGRRLVPLPRRPPTTNAIYPAFLLLDLQAPWDSC